MDDFLLILKHYVTCQGPEKRRVFAFFRSTSVWNNEFDLFVLRLHIFHPPQPIDRHRRCIITRNRGIRIQKLCQDHHLQPSPTRPSWTRSKIHLTSLPTGRREWKLCQDKSNRWKTWERVNMEGWWNSMKRKRLLSVWRGFPIFPFFLYLNGNTNNTSKLGLVVKKSIAFYILFILIFSAVI